MSLKALRGARLTREAKRGASARLAAHPRRTANVRHTPCCASHAPQTRHKAHVSLRPLTNLGP